MAPRGRPAFDPAASGGNYVYLGAAGKSLSESGDLSPWEWALLGAGLVATVVMAVILTRAAKKQLKSGRRVPTGIDPP